MVGVESFVNHGGDTYISAKSSVDGSGRSLCLAYVSGNTI